MQRLLQQSLKKLEETWLSKRVLEPLNLNFVGSILSSASKPEDSLNTYGRDVGADCKESKTENPKNSTKEDLLLNPSTVQQGEEFVEVVFRALSAAPIGDRSVDFSDAAMLRESVPLLNGQTVFKDHNTIVDNWVGRVVDTFWDAGSSTLPPGINARLRLDAVKDPMTVRGVQQGALHSVSVTVSFEWKPSHPELMEQDNFFRMLGEEVNGQEVRIIVTKIERYWEISLVWQGADVYAKQIGADGKPLLLSAENENKEKEAFAMKDKLKDTLTIFLGKQVDDENAKELLEAHVSGVVQEKEEILKKELSAKAQELDQATSLMEIKDKEILGLRAELAGIKKEADLGREFLASERKEAVRLCKLAKGDKVSPVILKTLEEADLSVVQAWKEEFSKEVEDRFPLQCGACGGKAVSRQSSISPEVKDEEGKDIAPVFKKAKHLHAE